MKHTQLAMVDEERRQKMEKRMKEFLLSVFHTQRVNNLQ
jgi:Fe-S cluster biosynthesis and repair protein YggX